MKVREKNKTRCQRGSREISSKTAFWSESCFTKKMERMMIVEGDQDNARESISACEDFSLYSVCRQVCTYSNVVGTACTTRRHSNSSYHRTDIYTSLCLLPFLYRLRYFERDAGLHKCLPGELGAEDSALQGPRERHLQAFQ